MHSFQKSHSFSAEMLHSRAIPLLSAMEDAFLFGCICIMGNEITGSANVFIVLCESLYDRYTPFIYKSL